ncbi:MULTISPECIES: OadG family protein [unclassified Algibacter]|uniref:OadG family protein n=1 Tax=unclassified Algibacter TaxID=2615009 RepID=UPI00131CF3D0|nr:MULTISPECIES: OadG family protein [unclassified Algibacter]MCL5129416.1 OadG family protein [Algibacter sp. L4_22]
MIHILLTTDAISEGYVILITGLLIVFCALITLALFFNYGLPLMLYVYKIITKGKDKKVSEIKVKGDKNFTGEISAVIGAAIHMHMSDQHDYESAILTIKQIKKPYSPWSSKIYGTQNRL